MTHCRISIHFNPMAARAAGFPTKAMEVESGKAIVRVLACVLDKLVAANDRLGQNHQITKFHALRAPSISVQDYLERIFKYAVSGTRESQQPVRPFSSSCSPRQ